MSFGREQLCRCTALYAASVLFAVNFWRNQLCRSIRSQRSFCCEFWRKQLCRSIRSQRSFCCEFLEETALPLYTQPAFFLLLVFGGNSSAALYATSVLFAVSFFWRKQLCRSIRSQRSFCCEFWEETALPLYRSIRSQRSFSLL